jgi:carbon-monoxide dehydrogenase medium subunit
MQQIEYLRPETVEEATEMLAEHGGDAVVLAGGQSLTQMLKQRLVGGEYVVDISAIDALDRIDAGADLVTVGAMVTYRTLQNHDLVRERVPVLAEALGTIGDVQIRSKGTFAGGIAHADPQGDPPVVASALDVTLQLSSADGERTVPASDFYYGLFDTELESDELLTGVEVPLLPPDAYSTYRAHAPRKGDYATASLAVILERDGETVTDARLVLGSIPEKPTPLDAVTEELVGEQLDEALVERAAERARETVTPYDDYMGSAEYKETLVGRLTADALTDALDEW